MTKMLVFDMDGTIADLYGVEGWLEMLKNSDATPYRVARPLVDMIRLVKLLTILKNHGWKIAVTTWLAKNSTKNYDSQVRTEKIAWLKKYGFPFDEIHLVKYGTTKAKCTRNKADFQILIDDNEAIRKGWTLGGTINANKNILEEIEKLLDK